MKKVISLLSPFIVIGMIIVNPIESKAEKKNFWKGY